MARNSFNIVKHDVDLCLLEAWHHDTNMVGKLGEFYFKRYGLFLEGKGGDFSDFILGLYWLSKARNAGIAVAYIWLVRMIDAYYASYNHAGYQSLVIDQFKAHNKNLCSYVCDEKPIDFESDDLEKVNLAQFFLNNSGKFCIEYTCRMRSEYIVAASEHGYAYGDPQDYADDCVVDYDDDENTETIIKPKELNLFLVLRDYLKNSFGGKYKENTLVQDFKSDLLNALEHFGEGEEIDNDFSFYFTNGLKTGHDTLEINFQAEEIQIMKYGYIEGECGGDSYTNWQCTIFLNGEYDTDIDVDCFVESIRSFVNKSSSLSIMEPNWYNYEEDFDSREDEEELRDD